METLVTRLTKAPEIGRGLSVGIGESGEALANAARSGGQLYTASVPKALIEELRRVGLLERRVTRMGGEIGTKGTELRFLPAASEFIVPFFKK
jgi:hypothetical protein